MLNQDLSLSQWYTLRNLSGGMHGVDPNDPTQLANPAECTVRPRLVTLNPGQHVYRWVDSDAVGPLNEDKACGAWWSTKRGAQQILKLHETLGHRSSEDAARVVSNIAKSFSKKLDQVVCARVVQPVRCFLGVGLAVTEDEEFGGGQWDSRAHQLYIPHLGEKDESRGVWTMTADARAHMQVAWVKSATTFGREDWNAEMDRQHSA